MDKKVSPGGGDTLTKLRPLDAAEVRLLAEAQLGELRDFARSARLHAVDGKGDTPLHIAARCGKLALCDMLIRHGADPNVTNTSDQTAADVAASEAHLPLSQLLQALEQDSETDCDLVLPMNSSAHTAGIVVSVPIANTTDPADFELSFEAEADPQSFRHHQGTAFSEREQAAFIPGAAAGIGDEAPDWELDLSQAPLAGDGISHEAAVARTQEREGEFLVTQSRGRKSTKPALLPVGTKMSIEALYCRQWAVEAINSHRVPAADFEALILSCRGNADGDDLWKEIIQISNVAGLEHVSEDDPAILDPAIVVDEEDLAEALEAALTRQTRLPGTGRFFMDRADEETLVGQMWQIKGGLHLAIVSSDNAVRVILRFAEMVLAGQLRPEYLTLLAVFPGRENDPGSTVLREVADTLRSVVGDGAVIEGKRRRMAVQAVDRLDLSAVFFKALSKYLSDQPGDRDVAASIRDQLAELERSTERLIITHLPYVRRFASRYAEDGEDLEDVFQVAFMGMQRSTRRFDPDRGIRFLIYAAYWMRQALTRWRADERAIIRVPVHRHADLAALDEAFGRLELVLGRTPTSGELASDREWTEQHVEKLLTTPRVQVEWDELGPEWLSAPAEQEARVEVLETSKVVADALSELKEKDADIIRKRFGFGGAAEMTLEEVGQIYGVTRERIRQIEAKALRQLSHAGRIKKLRALVGA